MSMLRFLGNLWHKDLQFPKDVEAAIKQADIIALCLSRYTREHFEKALTLLGKIHPNNLRIETEGATMNVSVRFLQESQSLDPSYLLCEAPMTHRDVEIYDVIQCAHDHIPRIHSTALVRPGISHTQKVKSAQFVANPGGHELLVKTLQEKQIDTISSSSLDGIEVLSNFFRRHMYVTTTSSSMICTPEDPLGRSENRSYDSGI